MLAAIVAAGVAVALAHGPGLVITDPEGAAVITGPLIAYPIAWTARGLVQAPPESRERE